MTLSVTARHDVAAPLRDTHSFLCPSPPPSLSPYLISCCFSLT